MNQEVRPPQAAGFVAEIADYTGDSPTRQLYVKILNERFLLEDLKTIAYDLGIDWESLSGETRPGKIRALYEYLEHRSRTFDLVSWIKNNRKDIRLPDGSASPFDQRGQNVKYQVNIGSNSSGIAIGDNITQKS